MARNEFEVEVGQLLNRYFPRVIRIPDSNTNRTGGFQVSQKPYDYCGACQNGIYFSAEVKRIKQSRFSFDLLKDHQDYNLRCDFHHKLHPFIFINWRVGNRGGVAAWIPFFKYDWYRYKLNKENKKSIKPSDIDEVYFLKRITGGWDLTSELKELYADLIIHNINSS